MSQLKTKRYVLSRCFWYRNCCVDLYRSHHVSCYIYSFCAQMDRVHRIGQKRPVKAIRFIMDGSIEERFIKLQNAKEALGKGSLQKLKQEDRQRARLTAMNDLFEVGEQVEHWDGKWLGGSVFYGRDTKGPVLIPFISHT
jgi:hypothetical protein